MAREGGHRGDTPPARLWMLHARGKDAQARTTLYSGHLMPSTRAAESDPRRHELPNFVPRGKMLAAATLPGGRSAVKPRAPRTALRMPSTEDASGALRCAPDTVSTMSRMPSTSSEAVDGAQGGSGAGLVARGPRFLNFLAAETRTVSTSVGCRRMPSVTTIMLMGRMASRLSALGSRRIPGSLMLISRA